ncbi:hypothetical protein HPB47_023885 [Ixodes persulcatus]|uniref:Uncharacterized protein n=1 Tax=Ixodes persulcatus TaxID=34615 RepID=A0AC60Q675_IXOPE|nr:hypothetical protein HPB47_023885 [Ixodes persulcatus]
MSGVTTDPEPCGHGRSRLAVRDFPVRLGKRASWWLSLARGRCGPFGAPRVETEQQSKALLGLTSIADHKVTVTPHQSLNTIRGVISEDDLLESTEDESLEGLSNQGVIARGTYAAAVSKGAVPTTASTFLPRANPNPPKSHLESLKNRGIQLSPHPQRRRPRAVCPHVLVEAMDVCSSPPEPPPAPKGVKSRQKLSTQRKRLKRQFLSELGRGSQPDRQHDHNFAAFRVPVSVPPIDTCTPAADSTDHQHHLRHRHHLCRL